MSLQPPLHVALRPSRKLAALFVLAHATVAAAVLWVRPDFTGALVLALAAAGLYSSLYYHAWRRAETAAISLTIERDGTARVGLRNGASWQARILPTTFVHPLLTVVNLRVEGRRLSYHVIMVPDAVESAAFRRLRVWLLWGYRPEVKPGHQGADPTA